LHKNWKEIAKQTGDTISKIIKAINNTEYKNTKQKYKANNKHKKNIKKK